MADAIYLDRDKASLICADLYLLAAMARETSVRRRAKNLAEHLAKLLQEARVEPSPGIEPG
ncbi:hypothetical protein [Mycobacteroides abscessus]|uniref:hypothetical protein n=1 Tax=Mycobacteroides abscessus TaxID=36809 RepID=UPI00104CEA7D|nr:hypothetical protein [Mycobacteroides abscessus]